jgi:hypothetical protein
MGLCIEDPVAFLERKHLPDKLAHAPVIVNLEFLPGHQGRVTFLGSGVKGEGIRLGSNGAGAVPFPVGSVAEVMEEFDPGSIRRSSKVSESSSSPEVLTKRGKTLDTRQLIRFTIDISIYFLALQRILAFPGPRDKLGAIGQVQIHFAVPRPILEGVGLEVHPSFGQEKLTEIAKLRLADVILQANEVHSGPWNRREA